MNHHHFIWISGAINSGKSTIAKALSEQIGKAANIELDVLSEFTPALDIDHKLEFVISDALMLAANWQARGYIPVLNWPLYGEEVAYMFRTAQQVGLMPILINLIPSLEHLSRNRGNRPLEEWELQRITYMHNVCRINEPAHGHCIDNGELSLTDTLAMITGILNSCYPGTTWHL